MLRRTNFGMMVDDLGTSSEDEKALADLIKIAESVGMEIIENETAISIKFCVEVMKRLVESGMTERMHLLNHIENLQELIKRIEKRETDENAKALPVVYSGDGYADGNIVYDFAKCPNCGYEYEDGDKDWKEQFCPHCGQALKWTVEESE